VVLYFFTVISNSRWVSSSFGDWQELSGGPVITTAILDRLLQHCKVINIKGHSYQLWEHAFAKKPLSRR
jgi:DNA replication protein DnaC